MIYQLERFPLNKLSVSMGIPEFLDSGRKCWTLVSGRWTLDSGRWTLDSGFLTLDARRYILEAGLWTLDTIVDCFKTKSESSF